MRALFDRFVLLRFLVAGLATTALNYGVFFALLQLGVPTLPAGAAGFLAGAVLGFFLHRAWTFRSAVSTKRGMPAFFLVQLLSLGGHLLTQYAALRLGVPAALSQLCGIAVSTVLNFTLSKLFVFAAQPVPNPALVEHDDARPGSES